MKNYEFETHIPNYAFPFLVEYSVEKGKPVLENVIYDELVLSIPDLAVAVSSHINWAMANNFNSEVVEVGPEKKSPSKVKYLDRALFFLIMNLLADSANTVFHYAGRLWLKQGNFSDDKVLEIVKDMQKQISESPENMRTSLGELIYTYFLTVDLTK